MTIITKAITEKKPSDKLEQPLVVAGNEAKQSTSDPEAQRQKPSRRYYVISRKNIQSIHVTATFLLFLVALMILIIGVIGGLYVYRQYTRAQLHKLCTGWYNIPYDNANKLPFAKDAVHQSLLADSDLFNSLKNAQDQEGFDIEKDFDSKPRNFFKERFEIDLDNEEYEKIDVPDFRGGRRGRFVHDFNINKTGIVDIDGQCCFVMPLNRQKVLPPRNVLDLLLKMREGYYTVNTEVVRETMRVILPPISDLSSVGVYIARECQNLPTYMLEKVDPTSIVKRSVPEAMYGQYVGTGIYELDIINWEEAKNFHQPATNVANSQK